MQTRERTRRLGRFGRAHIALLSVSVVRRVRLPVEQIFRSLSCSGCATSNPAQLVCGVMDAREGGVDVLCDLSNSFLEYSLVFALLSLWISERSDFSLASR